MALFHVALLFSLLVVYSHGRLYEKLFVMNFENKGFNTVASNYKWKALIDQSFLLPNYYAITHPSQPNYVAQIAGDYFTCTSDSNCNLPYETIVDRLEEKGFTWKAYMESYKYSGNETCYMSNSSPYVRHHNPFMSFTTITSTTRCKNIVNEEQFQEDVRSNTLPTFGFYSPNVYNDSHDRDLYFSGLYLQNFLKTWYFPYLKTTWKDTLFMVTWDEDGKDENNHVVTFFKHPCLSSGVAQVGEVNYTHYSILKFLENNFGLESLGRNDANAADFAKALPCTEPVIELKCPASIQLQLDDGQLSAIVNYTDPILRYGDNEQAVVSGMVSQYSTRQPATYTATNAGGGGGGGKNNNNGNGDSNSGTSIYDDGSDYVEPEIVSEVSVQLTTGLSSGSEFPIGETRVVFKASDDFGRSCQCSFSVLIESVQHEAEEVELDADDNKDAVIDTQDQPDNTQRGGDRFAATSTTMRTQSVTTETLESATVAVAANATNATVTVVETTESELELEEEEEEQQQQQPSLENESEHDQQQSVKSQPNTLSTTTTAAETNEEDANEEKEETHLLDEDEKPEETVMTPVSLDPDDRFAATSTSMKTASTSTSIKATSTSNTTTMEGTIEIETDVTLENEIENTEHELAEEESESGSTPTTTKSQPSTVTPVETELEEEEEEEEEEENDLELAGGESESIPTTTKSQPSTTTTVTPAAEATDAEIDAEIPDIDVAGESESVHQEIVATKVKAASHTTAVTSFSTTEQELVEEEEEEHEEHTVEVELSHEEATAPADSHESGSASTKSTTTETPSAEPSVDTENEPVLATESPEEIDPATATTKSQPASTQTQVDTNDNEHATTTPSEEDNTHQPVDLDEEINEETQTQQQSTVGIKSQTTTSTIKATAVNNNEEVSVDTENEDEKKEIANEEEEEEDQTPTFATNEENVEATSQNPEYVSSVESGVEDNSDNSTNTTDISSSSSVQSPGIQQDDNLTSPPVVPASENSVTYVVIAVVFSLSFLIMITVSIWAYKRRQREGTKGEKAHLYSPLQGNKQKEENFYYGV